MDVKEAWKIRVSSRSFATIIPLVALLVASLCWNLRQHRLIDQEHMAAEREAAARARTEAEQTTARLKKKAELAASDARVQQLYREINNFSQIHERLLSQIPRSTPKKIDNPGEVDTSP